LLTTFSLLINTIGRPHLRARIRAAKVFIYIY
jgi:hypothetical protein